MVKLGIYRGDSMKFGIIFNEKLKMEMYTAGAGLDTPGRAYPIGHSLIDFIELDFLERLDMPAGEPENPILRFFPDLPRAAASGFFKSQEWLDDMVAIRTAVDFVLALNNSLFNGLTIAQRFFLYEKHLGEPGRARMVATYSSRPAGNVSFFAGEDSLEADAGRIASGEFEIVESFEAVTYLDACHIVLMKMIKNNMAVKECACCGRLFIPGDGQGKYCDRKLRDGRKTCKEAGYLKKMESDPLLKLYNTAYKTKHAQKQRLARGGARAEAERYERALVQWRGRARRALDECRPKYEACIDNQMKALMMERLKAQLDEDIAEFV